MRTPRAFISYSWDDGAHKMWVRDNLARRLRKDGVDVMLDQWHAAPGDQLPAFMERAIRENDFVLIICTPKYKAKSDTRHGGVGYEGDVIHGEIFVMGNHRKFIPILRRGEWLNSSPTSLQGKYYIDLRDGLDYEDNYHELLRTLHGNRERAPAVGSRSLPASSEQTVSDYRESRTADAELPRPRHYTFISERKVNELFPQIPKKYVRTFQHALDETSPYYKVVVVSQYIQEKFNVGTIESPKAYFKGTITARCLVTDSKVFFGSMIETPSGSNKYKYVGLSGSLKHMLDAPFRELANYRGNVVYSWLHDSLRRANAEYIPLNSNTADFHNYLVSISIANQRNEQGIMDKLQENWKLFLLGLLISILPLVAAIFSWRFIGFWALILIVIAVLWALFGIIVTISLSSFEINLGPSLEESIRAVTRSLRSPAEKYEFLARTIAVREYQGETVLLGSPIYIALGEYES